MRLLVTICLQVHMSTTWLHEYTNVPILRTFVSQDVSLLIRAYLVYVRPVVEYNTVVWSPYTINDIETIERVQRRFTKKLPGLRKFSYDERLSRLHLHSLELRRLLTDLVWCYKILFGIVEMSAADEFLVFSTVTFMSEVKSEYRNL